MSPSGVRQAEPCADPSPLHSTSGKRVKQANLCLTRACDRSFARGRGCTEEREEHRGFGPAARAPPIPGAAPIRAPGPSRVLLDRPTHCRDEWLAQRRAPSHPFFGPSRAPAARKGGPPHLTSGELACIVSLASRVLSLGSAPPVPRARCAWRGSPPFSPWPPWDRRSGRRRSLPRTIAMALTPGAGPDSFPSSSPAPSRSSERRHARSPPPLRRAAAAGSRAGERRRRIADPPLLIRRREIQ